MTWLRANLEARGPLWPVAAARMVIGILWLFSLRWKLPPDFTAGAERSLLDWLQLEVQYPALPFYGELVATVVIPNFIFFAWLLFLAELLVGLSLLSGTLTRLGGAVGFLMAINLGIGLLEVPGEWPWSYVMLAMWHGLFVVTGAGRSFGVDRWLLRRHPESSWLQYLS